MNNALIPIPAELAAEQALAARNEDRRQSENQRAFAIFVAAAVVVGGLALLLVR